MLDLEAGVHLEERERVGGDVDEELDGARRAVVHRLARAPGRGLEHARAQRIGQSGRGRLLDHLLVAALGRAVAVAEGRRHAPVAVAEDLHLDVARVREPALEVDALVAERRAGLAAHAVERVGEVSASSQHAHADPAAAGGRLQHHGIADGPRALERSSTDSTIALPGKQRDARGLGCVARGVLRAEDAQLLGRRPDEREPGRFDVLGEVGAFGEESVAGMDGLARRRSSAAVITRRASR